MPVTDFPPRPSSSGNPDLDSWLDKLGQRQSIDNQIALTGVASGDEVGIFDVSASVFRKITVTNLTAGLGTVTSVSVTTANGVSGSVANPTTTPAISLTLGAITPTSVSSQTFLSASGTMKFSPSGTQALILNADQTAEFSKDVLIDGSSALSNNLQLGSLSNPGKEFSLGMTNTFNRFRERNTANNFAWTTNMSVLNVQDDATKSSWQAQMGSGTDSFILSRSPAGSSTFTTWLSVSSAGLVTIPGSATITGTLSLSSDLALGIAKQLSLGMTDTTARFRERVAANDFAWTTNINISNVQDDASKSSWQAKMGANSDAFTLSRSPAGSGTLAALATFSSVGALTLADGINLGNDSTLGVAKQLSYGMTNTKARFRERDSADNFAWTTNINVSNVQDDAAQPSWKVRVGAGSVDNFIIARSPAGSSTFVTNFLVDSSGRSGFGATPSAVVTIKAGTAAAGTAPKKIADGTRLTTAEVGVHEVESNHYLTNWKLLRFPIGGPIFDHFADVGNGTTVETDLYSDTLLANTFAINGDKVTAEYAGTFSGAVASTQEIKVYFGGTVIYDTGALSIGVATDGWRVSIVCIRASSSVVRCSVSVVTGFGTAAASSTYTAVTGLTLTNTQILKITGTAAGAGALSNQIVASIGSVEYKPAVN